MAVNLDQATLAGFQKQLAAVFFLWPIITLDSETETLIKTLEWRRNRVPTQIAFSNSLCFPCMTVNFPCANLRDLWLLHTLNCLIQILRKNGKFLRQIPKYLLLLGSGKLQLEQTKFPVFWQNFQIPCLFPDRDFFWPFFLFSLFSLGRGYPEKIPPPTPRENPSLNRNYNPSWHLHIWRK